MDKSKIQYIRARQNKKDYVYNGIAKKGYDIFTPYYGNCIPLRILREIWFRGNFPKKDIWFNKKALSLKSGKRIILLKDPLIRKDYLAWLQKNNPNKVIILEYENRAKTTINPDDARPYVTEMLSYDMDDCINYDMTFRHYALENHLKKTDSDKKVRDVLFVGRDKGRVEKLRSIKNRLEKQGLSVLLYICANRSFQRFNKPYYKRLLDYEEYLEMAHESRAILNIMPEGQTSITQRDLEAIVYNIKEITNNKGIKDFEFYDPSRYFVLDIDCDDSLREFIYSDFKPLTDAEMNKYTDEKIYGDILEKYF